MSDEKPSCGHMDSHPQNDWGTVRYDSRFDVYWIPAGSAKQALFFCPWCGEKLPSSLRDRWFDELEAAGIDPATHPIPEPYRTGAWRGVLYTPAPPHHQGSIEGRYTDFFDLPDEPTSED